MDTEVSGMVVEAGRESEAALAVAEAGQESEAALALPTAWRAPPQEPMMVLDSDRRTEPVPRLSNLRRS
jgi:hypothetical protein